MKRLSALLLLLFMAFGCTDSGPTAITVDEIATASKKGQNKVDVCHITGDGSYNLIRVAQPAIPAHLGHGDALPGDPVPGMAGFIFDASCQPVEAVPLDGLLLFSPFNGNANDESGNGNHGTVHGASPTVDRFGNGVGAYSFNGAGDFISYGDVDFLDGASGATFSIWIRYSNHTGLYDPFINKGALDADGPIQLNQSTVDGNRIAGVLRGIGGASFGLSPNSADDGNWHHILMTFENKDVRVYIDGVLASTIHVSDCSAIANDANPLTLAKNFNPTQTVFYWYQGDMDDLRIYNRALSGAEILTLFHEGGWL